MAGVFIWGLDIDTGKWHPVQVDENGVVSVLATVSGEISAKITHWGTTALTSRDISLMGLGFRGLTYENEDVATTDAARRFETVGVKLRDTIIQVKNKDQLFGDSSNQRYLVAAGEAIGFTQVNLSTLYFKNADAGQHGTVRILGMED